MSIGPESISQTKTYIMKNQTRRITIYPKDVMQVLELSYRQSVRILHKVRRAVNKEKDDYVTIEEFCLVMKFPRETVEAIIF